jgi:asparagine synthase (glutamine-hydrolysing)
MCGFAGFVHFRKSPFDPTARRGVLLAMSQVLGHRGPDDEVFFDDGVLALVFRRLSIVDGRHGRQPIFNEDGGLLVVANGEIYNHSELRAILSTHHRFSTGSDTEVLLHGYEEWGVDVLNRIRGIFAGAIWDSRERQLLLARDHLGVKPLYVCRLPDGLLFGSELKALLAHPHCPRTTDWDAVAANPLAVQRTPSYLQGIEFVPGGNYLFVKSGEPPRSACYWQLEDHLGSAPYGIDSESYVERYQQLLEEAVMENIPDDVPFGLHLSGGTDSSLLAAIIARKKKFPCFTVVERTTYLAGDVESAGSLAQTLGLPWVPVLFDYRTLLDQMSFDLSHLEHLVWMMDSPRFDLEWIIKEALTRAARTRFPELKVLMIGQGADEFAGGYSNRLDRRNTGWSIYLADEIAPMLASHLQPDGTSHLPDHNLLFPERADPIKAQAPYHQAMLLMARQLQFHNLWHEDRTNAWHSIEARVPFLDHRIVELLASVPAELHATLFWDKRIVRDCARRYLPEQDWNRPKIGFCATDDTRSIELIVHTMAIRLADQLLRQYDWPGLPRAYQDRIERLANRVRHREAGFVADSFLLLQDISAAIFAKQCLDGPPEGFLDHQLNDSALAVIEPDHWPAVAANMAAQPLIEHHWQIEQVVLPPAGAEIECGRTTDGSHCFSLRYRDSVHASFEVPATSSWVEQFLIGLYGADHPDRTIEHWLDDLQIPAGEFFHTLDVLYHCGFVRCTSFSS